MHHVPRIFFLLLVSLASWTARADDSCIALYGDLEAYMKVKPDDNHYKFLQYQLTSSSEKGWVGHSTGRLYYAGNRDFPYLTSVQSQRQLFSDRAIPCSGNGCFVQPFDKNKADSILVDIPSPRQLRINFQTWNYTASVDISCNGEFMYARQGNEFHVLSFKKMMAQKS